MIKPIVLFSTLNESTTLISLHFLVLAVSQTLALSAFWLSLILLLILFFSFFSSVIMIANKDNIFEPCVGGFRRQRQCSSLGGAATTNSCCYSSSALKWHRNVVSFLLTLSLQATTIVSRDLTFLCHCREWPFLLPVTSSCVATATTTAASCGFFFLLYFRKRPLPCCFLPPHASQFPFYIIDVPSTPLFVGVSHPPVAIILKFWNLGFQVEPFSLFYFFILLFFMLVWAWPILWSYFAGLIENLTKQQQQKSSSSRG